MKDIRAVITSEMQEIIDRWGNEPKMDNFIFPLIDYFDDPIKHKAEVNSCIRRIDNHTSAIGKQIGIGKVTTYIIRYRGRYFILINMLYAVIFSIGNDLETSLPLRSA